MLHFSRWKIVAIVLTCLLGAMAAVPNFFSKTSIKSWPGWLYNSQINLGLDLRGGAHMLAQIDVAGLKKEWLDNIRDDMRSRLRKAQIGYTGLGNVGDKVQVTIVKVEDEEWGTIRMPNIVPRFSRTPGEIRWSGLGIGRHQDEILAPAEEDS